MPIFEKFLSLFEQCWPKRFEQSCPDPYIRWHGSRVTAAAISINRGLCKWAVGRRSKPNSNTSANWRNHTTSLRNPNVVDHCVNLRNTFPYGSPETLHQMSSKMHRCRAVLDPFSHALLNYSIVHSTALTRLTALTLTLYLFFLEREEIRKRKNNMQIAVNAVRP